MKESLVKLLGGMGGIEEVSALQGVVHLRQAAVHGVQIHVHLQLVLARILVVEAKQRGVGLELARERRARLVGDEAEALG